MAQKLPNNLIIAFRYNQTLYNQEELEAYINHLKALTPKQIICATSRENPAIPILQKQDIEVLEYENYNNIYYTKPILDFYKSANPHHLLIISYSVELKKWQLEHGFDFLRSRNLLCVGWRILQQENDGSYIGRLAYNTCMLHEPYFYDKVLQAGGIPEYVQNGSLGNITISLLNTNKQIPIGAQEDLAIQLRLYKLFFGKRHKLFGHITHYGLNYLSEQNQNNSLNDKIIRKVITAEIYAKIEKVNPKDFLDSWVII